MTAEPMQSNRVVLDQPEVEHRFLVDPLQYKAFIGCVAPHLSSEVRDTSPVSHLLTTYYDTPDRRFFQRVKDAGAQFVMAKDSVVYHHEAAERRRSTRPRGAESMEHGA